MDPFIGEIKMFGGNFNPRDFAFCNGTLMSIAQNSALFAIIGTIYGGDGRVSFALPDLRGRIPVGMGRMPGGSIDWKIGQMAGKEDHTLTVAEIPAHSHTATMTGADTISANLNASGDNATATGANNKFLAEAADKAYLNNVSNAKTLNAGSITIDTSSLAVSVGKTGGDQTINLLQPYLAINYIISLKGIFPTRN